ncbi:S41 family peptidase [Patescibacteria group bacterium]|nr:S41 family peptidase [Patescibacteria group bacterium]
MEKQENLSEQSGKTINSSSRLSSGKLRVFFLILISGCIGYYAGITKIAVEWKNFQPSVEVVNKEPPPSVSKADFAPLWTVMQKLEATYYDRKVIDAQKFVDGAITGLVGSLDDPYTVYLPPVKNNDFKQGLAGKFEGIGAELGMKEKQIIIVAPLDGSPAQKAGLRAGDLIVKVNSDFTNGWSLSEAVDKIRGPKGTSVILTVLQKSELTTKELAIIRDTITIKSVISWTKKIKDIDELNKKTDVFKGVENEKIIYVRLSQFGDNTNTEWQSVAVQIDRELKVDKDIRGVVLDVRNNPGGYLTDAVYIISEFIKDGAAVMQEDRNGDRIGYKVNGKGLLYKVPLVVLINRGSASASEIVAGAIQDYKRGVLVGETSFGKGTIQQAEDLGGGSGLHITIAKWLTPNGNWVHQKGLTPDIKADVDTKDPSHDAQLEKAVEELVKE